MSEVGGVKYTPSPRPISSIPADLVLFATWSVGFLCSNLRQELGLFLVGKVSGGDERGF